MLDLGKWPRLLVAGQSVTCDQAGEILLRTNDWLSFTNDGQWLQEISELTGLPVCSGRMLDFGAVNAFQQRYGVLRLSYLQNRQIASAHIAGPHGWCMWNGSIGCAIYNIGKYPTIEAVTRDWEMIATAFPFLDLQAQLVPDEGQAGFPVVGWRVAGGKVEVDLEPRELLRSPLELDEADLLRQVLLPGTERGVDAPRLAEALNALRSRTAGPVAGQ